MSTSVDLAGALVVVDVGGSKTLMLLMGVDRLGGVETSLVLARGEFQTPVGKKDGFFDSISKEFKPLISGCPDGVKLLPFVGFGMPGRFVNGVIAPGSAGNLGSTKNEFDGVDPKKELEDRVDLEFFVGNDAVAQMGYGLKTILVDDELKKDFLNQKVCYVGPGTGLGGGFGKVDVVGSVEFFTDGHIFDMVLPGFSENVKLVLYVDDQTIDVVVPSENPVAEDLLSGRALSEIMGAVDEKLVETGLDLVFSPLLGEVDARLLNEIIENQKDDRAFGVARQIAEFEGRVLAKVVGCVYAGDIVKSTEQAQWPAEDVESVKGTTRFIIGGSVGTTGELGRIVRDTAKAELSKTFPDTNFVLQEILGSTADSGAIGASMFIPKNKLEKEVG